MCPLNSSTLAVETPDARLDLPKNFLALYNKIFYLIPSELENTGGPVPDFAGRLIEVI